MGYEGFYCIEFVREIWWNFPVSTSDPRKVPVKTPFTLIIGSVGVGLLVFGLILYAVFFTGTQITDARMRGFVTKKEFIPQKEEQVAFGAGGVVAAEFDGRYLIFVEVKFRDGTTKEFEVDLRDKRRFDQVNVGDEFDVGPYVQPDTVP